jgi:translocator protein
MENTSQWWMQPEYIAAAIGIIVAVVGGLLTEVGPWYKALKTPKWKPPDWAFGPIWTVIIVMAAISGVLAWRQASNSSAQFWLVISFGVNCVLNIAWSWFFFKLKRPDWAMIETCFLWLSIVLMMIVTYPMSTMASLLLVPYLIWVSIASVLNWVTVKMNRPFGALK